MARDLEKLFNKIDGVNDGRCFGITNDFQLFETRRRLSEPGQRCNDGFHIVFASPLAEVNENASDSITTQFNKRSKGSIELKRIGGSEAQLQMAFCRRIEPIFTDGGGHAVIISDVNIQIRRMVERATVVDGEEPSFQEAVTEAIIPSMMISDIEISPKRRVTHQLVKSPTKVNAKKKINQQFLRIFRSYYTVTKSHLSGSGA